MSETRSQQLSRESWQQGDFTGWFDKLYAEAQGDPDKVPWADLAPNKYLVRWLNAGAPPASGGRALVVGCGLGDDAEAVAAAGWGVTAFDISAQAVAWSQRRFPNSPVTYETADLLAPPDSYRAAFNLIVEIYTLQALPPAPRPQAVASLASCLAPGGRIFIFGRWRDDADPPGSTPPMPLTHADLAGFEAAGLTLESFEDFFDDGQPPVRRFRAVYVR